MQQQLDNERAKRNRQTWMWVGIGLVVIIAIILGFRAYMKSKAKPVTVDNLNPSVTPKTVASPKIQAI
ncbi:hypothetical protein D3C80_1463130 [compost metagenome]